ncbi:MAG: hypothetical protein ICV72_05915 [Aldersonia sp.]|nr:hypothetical protein [Aldersonia sp.]
MPAASVSHQVSSRLSRRATLRLAAGAVTATFVAGSAAACAGDDSDAAPPEVDPLIAEADRARIDAAAALAAITLAPQRGAALQTIADQRTAHANALQAEITRAAGRYEDGSMPTTTTATTTPVAPPASIDALRDQLTAAQRAAADLARSQSDFRAGLLGSVSAACATHAAVLLA